MSLEEQTSLDDGRIIFEREEPTFQRRLRDPVCGMEVTPETAAASREHLGTPFYFCSTKCRDKFDAEPGRYAG
ncbi:MAG: copper-translocating P-type ATPase [Myxococcales bacterium]|nr:copper-translocating P-type ATPase [Myxococcales bacterium]